MVAVIITVVSMLALALGTGLWLMWRLHRHGQQRVTEALAMVTQERERAAEQQRALRRYEVAFSAVSGRGELGEQALTDTARMLGLREGLHYRLQPDLAGAGSARPDLVLLLDEQRQVPVDAKASLGAWLEAVETDDADERAEALRVHARALRARGTELAGREYQRWADAIYGTVMFVPSDAAVVAALDTDPTLLGGLLARRVFLCGPTGFGVVAAAVRMAGAERSLQADVEQLQRDVTSAHRAAGQAVDAVNVSGTHLQRFLAARQRELAALEGFRAAAEPLNTLSRNPNALSAVRAVSDEESSAAGGAAEPRAAGGAAGGGAAG